MPRPIPPHVRALVLALAAQPTSPSTGARLTAAAAVTSPTSNSSSTSPASTPKRRSVRAIVTAAAALGHRVSRSTVARILATASGKPGKARPRVRVSRALPPAARIARAALRATAGADGASVDAALVALELAAAELRRTAETSPAKK